jgi:RNA polymerase sigma-70 factor (ECF subfamily)
LSNHFAPATSRADRTDFFERNLWPHLAAAYNFARWMVHNHHDAEDIVQESFVKAFKSAETFRGTDPRSWLLAIVRNSALNFLSRGKQGRTSAIEETTEPADSAANPEASMEQSRRTQVVRAAIARLPQEFREALLLREMEGMAYKEIAYVLKVPIGTVMSRLSRARALLVEELIVQKEARG